MKKQSYIIFLLSVFVLTSWSPVGEEWISKLKTTDFEVFRSSSLEKPAFKCIGNLQTDYDAIIHYLFDLDMIRSRFPMCDHFEILEQVSSTEFILYLILDFPFPLRTRNLVINVSLTKNVEGGYNIHTIGQPHLIPGKKGFVRIPFLESHTTIHHNDKEMSFTQTSRVDLGGIVPESLLSLVIPKQMNVSWLEMKQTLESSGESIY